MHRIFTALAVFLAPFCVSAAAAEVISATPGAFVLEAEAEIAATPDAVWRALSRVDAWWSPDHTYSGDASRLSLTPRAGGCFCERWGRGQSVEHARVVLVMERDGVRTLRLAGGLGPLQELAAAGMLTFTVAPHAAGAKITMSYRVSGDAGLGLDQIAPLVDRVLMQQFVRLTRYADGGDPAA